MGLLTQEEYQNYCDRFNVVWKYLNDCSINKDLVIRNICELRGYLLNGAMPNMLNEIGFVYLDVNIFDKDKLKNLDLRGDLGLYTDKGEFLLTGRYIFPVKDMLGNVIALIGWFPDDKKYITTPSRLFSKQGIFFGMEQLKRTGIGNNYFLVEGIFDSISVRSLGYNCVALMGITVSSYTEVLYSLFRKIVAIPDNDTEGRKVVMGNKWRLPTNSSYLRWKGNLKDIDDLIKFYDMRGVLSAVWNESDRIITIDC